MAAMDDFPDFSNPTARERAIMAQGILSGLTMARSLALQNHGPALFGALDRATMDARADLRAAVRHDLEQHNNNPNPGGGNSR